MTTHIFGIRHHGPGSARSLRQALEKLQPDAILVEGPPDADAMLPLLVHPEMQPPVALLIYVPDQPQNCVYYPFAVFSPEWQALHYGLTYQVPVQFMDLPQTHQLAQIPVELPETPPKPEPETIAPPEEVIEDPDIPIVAEAIAIRRDPLRLLAIAAGYPDGERWWEHMVEQRQDSTDLFVAILEAMTALRQEVEALPMLSTEDDPIEVQREAYMRQTIRAAQKQGYQRIAVVCGAWHAPALVNLPAAKADATLLKKLPKVKVEATWVPWTYGRLSLKSGYGAGVNSPGWYDHLWTEPNQIAIRWMTKVARLLREQDLDASSAHVIEAVRLAEALAALRDRALPGLAELNEATRSIFCFGDDTPMRLIHDQLIVSDRLGVVPNETPMVPLQQDLQRHQKRLRLPPELTQKTVELDLRKPNDLERSHLLHRLKLLEIPWGESQQANSKGTFKEAWRLQWQPEFAVKLIEAGIWGNTVQNAASAIASDRADKATDLPTLSHLLDQVILAELPETVQHLMMRLQAEAAVASDIAHLMETLPPLANILRYGNVRKTDTEMIAHVIDNFVARICIGLPGACASLDDEAAATMDAQILQVNHALTLLQNSEYLQMWHDTLQQLSDRNQLHGLIAGHCCRLLLDVGIFDTAEATQRMGVALSTANDPPAMAAWVEGFLKGSGLLLLHNDALWQILDEWVTQLSADTFTALLPLLRRTFATFSAPERRQMGERVRRGNAAASSAGMTREEAVDRDRADAVLPLIAQLLGVTIE